mmetsp:Transcript_115378/g.230052  ORF Transcript_115378/g.230052 Transcript_115378/m.230052 type:complete len:86 (+) Transcript_115378:2247-2504(+)
MDKIQWYGVFAMGTVCDFLPASPSLLTVPAWDLGEEAAVFLRIAQMKATKFVLESGGCLQSFRAVHGAGHAIGKPEPWQHGSLGV